MVNVVLIGFGAIAIAIGAVLYIVQFRQGLRADASKKWPRASGTVIASVAGKIAGAPMALPCGAAIQLSRRRQELPSEPHILGRQ